MALTSQIPHAGRNLFIATPGAAWLQKNSQRSLLFRCATSDGVVSARPSQDNSGLLAITDSHLVVLHDAARGTDRRCKLKSGDGDPRLLVFSPDSRTLYFTTTLSHSIQAYSISNAELTTLTHVHPSPPNVLAVSKDGNIIVSASPTPPVILMQDIHFLGRAPLQFQPSHSKYPVTCCSFRVSDHNSSVAQTFFLLGYQDGTLAVYRLSPRILHPANQHQKLPLHPYELGSIKKLHKAAMGGIAAAEFVPGYKSRIHVSGPATSLSITSKGPFRSRGRKDKAVLFSGDGTPGERTYEGSETLIAIGTHAGKAFVFNILGLLLNEIDMRAPIITIEWVGDMSSPFMLPSRHSSTATSISSPSQPVLSAVLAEYERSSDEEDQTTVKKATYPENGSNYLKPISIDPSLDLFSAPAYSSRPTSISQSRIMPHLNQTSPGRKDRTPDRPRKKPFPRPRLATETFKAPRAGSPPPPNPTLLYTRPGSRVSQAISTTSIRPMLRETRRWSETRVAPAHDEGCQALAVEYSPSEYSEQKSDSDVFVTPPMSKVRRDVRVFAGPSRDVTAAQRPSSSSKANNANGSVATHPKRRTGFEQRSSIKAMDGEAEESFGPSFRASLPEVAFAHLRRSSPKVELEHDREHAPAQLGRSTMHHQPGLPLRSPFPAPPGQRPQHKPSKSDGVQQEPEQPAKHTLAAEDNADKAPFRKFSFEIGLHELELSGEKRWKEGMRMRILQEEYEGLRGNIAALRREFREFKEVMLASRGVYGAGQKLCGR
ncbi:hypothetical protein BS50DRAFT_618931 [Corynespora cassiicola Philippines]|uniref:WD40 repeat-like protein n=1 Tax=Corynespora cassiicola Philippines TaxID=1448308 RepID=A0A2T2NX35_CORCC|nr:hypothetical protein BS50DRAFT_618931 [Corynespora cassiicola Philippines]